jgi:large subunit ribosomal protein L15
MNLADVRAAFIPRKSRKRLGRGWGSGHGKTSGHGNKGQQARSGGGPGPGFEGGQMPLYRRLPKRGFNNHRFRVVYAIVNVGQLEGAFGEGATVDATAIRNAHLINAKGDAPIKVLGGGDLSKKLHITVDRFSESAKRKIEASGGSITALNPAPPPKPKKAPPPKPAKPEKAEKAEKAAAEEPAAEPKATKPPKPPKAKKPKGPDTPEA